MPKFRLTQEDINRNRLVDPGNWYPVEIVNVYEELSSRGDSMNTKLDMKIIDGPFTGAMLYRTFNEKAPGYVIPLLKAFGVEIVPDQEYDLTALQGRRLRVFVKHSEYNGQIRNDVVDFRPL